MLRRALPAGISLAILGVVYARIGISDLLKILRSADPLLVGLGLMLIVPTNFLAAWRLRQLIPPPAHLSIAEAHRLVLVAGTLNLVLPSKLGDISKAVFMRRDLDSSLALFVVIHEKLLDAFSLAIWLILPLVLLPRGIPPALLAVCMMGLGLTAATILVVTSPSGFSLVQGRLRSLRFFPARLGGAASRWRAVGRHIWRSKFSVLGLAVSSVLLSFLFFLQMWVFTFSLGDRVAFSENISRAPLVMLAGLAPFTLTGIGTRDAALVALYAPFLTPSGAGALGLLITVRFLIIGLIGLPIVAKGAAAFRIVGQNARPPHAATREQA